MEISNKRKTARLCQLGRKFPGTKEIYFEFFKVSFKALIILFYLLVNWGLLKVPIFQLTLINKSS